MKKNKITILILGIVGVLIFGNQIALAQDSPSVFVSPANLTKNVGENFDLAIKVNPAGQKVCAVEGQLVLSKLTVQEISVADGIISQTPPSFSNNFYFLLGIPGCTTKEKPLFTVKVKANTVGKAKVSFKNIDIIGEGVSISSASVGGNYEIVIPKKTVASGGKKQKKVKKTQKPKGSSKTCVCEKWSSWENKGCGEGGCLETQRLQERFRVCNPPGCDIEKQTQCVNDPVCISLAKEKPEPSKTPFIASLLSTISNIITLGTGCAWLGVVIVIGVILLLIFAISLISKKYRKRKGI